MSALKPKASHKTRENNEAKLKPLLCAAQRGEQAEYAQLLQHLAQLARGYAHAKLANHADLEDFVQEWLLSVHKALPTFDASRPCMPWLGALLHYRLNDWLRSLYAQGNLQNAAHIPLEDVEVFLVDDATPEPMQYEYLHKAIETLPKQQKSVLQTMLKDDLTVTEAGQKLGLGVSAVKVNAHRAYKALRSKLSDL